MKTSFEMTQALIDQYGRINGDNDIIHYDHDYAVKRGFRGTLAHGMHVMGCAVDLAAREYGPAFFRGGEVSVKWIAPVCPGDLLEVELGPDGTVTATVPSGKAMIGEAHAGRVG